MIQDIARRGSGLAPVLALLWLSACDVPKPPELPDYATPARTVWLDQGWTPQQRQWYHHASQGTSTIPVPYSWFVALERPEFSIRSSGLLSDPDYLARFGFIPGTSDPRHNPQGLPIGFARTASEHPIDGSAIDQIGLTCAACHTAQLDYRGTAIMVDGGPALLDLGKFRTALALSVGLTEKLPFRFGRFAERVLGPNRTDEQEAQLKKDLGEFIRRGRMLQEIEGRHAAAAVEEGFGRLDALNRIGNEVFGTQMGRMENTAPRTAPVAFPHLWDTGWFDWVQYNGSIEQPMVRNAGEAMGVRALVNFKGGASPLFKSTIPIDNLYRMEALLMGTPPLPLGRFNGLRAPAWPGRVLPPVDAALASRGAALYRERCQGCHLPPVQSNEFWRKPGAAHPPHWGEPNAAGQQLLRVRMIPVDRIGTDPAQAVDMKARTVTVPAALGLTGELATNGTDKTYAFGPALGEVVAKTVGQWYDSRNPSVLPPDRNRMNGYRPNRIRDGVAGPNGTTVPAYKARPLNGIWATAPYLHNGSVPTLFHLLSPLKERPAIFHLGSREFDPVKVGYRTDKVAGTFEFNTAPRGNWNRGHLFDDSPDPTRRPAGIIGPRLSVEERAALVEYLKTL
jgi:mono/diheme cytochrome c family protein